MAERHGRWTPEDVAVERWSLARGTDTRANDAGERLEETLRLSQFIRRVAPAARAMFALDELIVVLTTLSRPATVFRTSRSRWPVSTPLGASRACIAGALLVGRPQDLEISLGRPQDLEISRARRGLSLQGRSASTSWPWPSGRGSSRCLQVSVHQPSCLVLGAGHQVPVAVERDRDIRVAHERGERLCVDARCDHQAGERVSALVQGDRLDRCGLPDTVRAFTDR